MLFSQWSVGSSTLAPLTAALCCGVRFPAVLARYESVLCNKLVAVMGGLLCQSPLPFEKPEGNGGAGFCEAESRADCAKEVVLGVGKTLACPGKSLWSFRRRATLEGRKEAPLTLNNLVALDHWCCKQQNCFQLVLKCAFTARKGWMIEQKPTVVLIQLLGLLFGFFSPLLCCS